MESDNLKSPHQGLLRNQVHPVRRLLHQLSEEFTQEDMQAIKMLVLENLKKSEPDDEPRWFYELVDVLVVDRGMDTLGFLHKLSEGPFAGRVLEDGTLLKDVIQNCEEQIFREKRKQKLDQRRKKDKYFQGRTDEMYKALEILTAESKYVKGIELHGSQCVGKSSLAEEIAHHAGHLLIATTSHRVIENRRMLAFRGKRTVKEMCISTLHALHSHTVSSLEGCPDKLIQQRAQFMESFYQKDDSILVEAICQKLQELKEATVLLLPNLEDIQKNNGKGLSRALSKILRTENGNVTVVWTVREQVHIQSNRLPGDVLRMEVKPLSQEDMYNLFFRVFKEIKENSIVILTDKQKDQVEQMCRRYSPFEIKALAKMFAETKDCCLDEKKSSPILHTVVESLPEKLRRILIGLSSFFSVFHSKLVENLGGNRGTKMEIGNLRQWFLIHESGMPSEFSKLKEDCFYYHHHTLRDFMCKQYRAEYCGLNSKVREEVENALFDYFETKSVFEIFDCSLFATLDENIVYLKKYFSCRRGLLPKGSKEKKTSLQILFFVASVVCDETEYSDYLAAMNDSAVSEQDDASAFESGVERIVFLRDIGRLDEAMEVMEILRKWVPKMDDTGHNHILARYYSTDGLLQMDLAKKSSDRALFDEALKLFHKSLEYFSKVIKKSQGSSVPKLMTVLTATQQSQVLSNIGHVYHRFGFLENDSEKHEKAFQKHKEALSTLRNSIDLSLNEDLHHDIPDYLRNMGICRLHQGMTTRPRNAKLYKEAIALFSKALVAKMKLGFLNNVPTALCYRDKADANRLLKEYSEADKNGLKALEILRKREKRPSMDFILTLHILGLNQYARGRNNAEELAREAYQKSADYYQELRAVIIKHQLKLDEMLHKVGHIRAVNLEVLKRLGDKSLGDVKRFYEALEDRRLSDWLRAQGPSVTEICDHFRGLDSDSDDEEDFVGQPNQLIKMDSGFGEGSIDNSSTSEQTVNKNMMTPEDVITQPNKAQGGLGDGSMDNFWTSRQAPVAESGAEEIEGHASLSKKGVLERQPEFDSVPLNFLRKQDNVDHNVEDPSSGNSFPKAKEVQENNLEPKRHLESPDKVRGAKKQDSGIGESIDQDEADMDDVSSN